MLNLNILIVCCALALTSAEVCGQVAGDPLETTYAGQRTAAVSKLNQAGAQQADAIGKSALQAGNLAAAEWSKRLSDADPENDADGLLSDPASRDPLVGLQTRYLKSRTEAITKVNRAFLPQFEGAQRQAMQRNSLPDATRAAERVAKIKEELAQAAAPGSGGATGDPLFGANKQKKWTAKKGTWKWEGTKLTGSGAGAFEYDGSFQPPFVAQFRYRIVKGLRARVDFNHAGLQNTAYKEKIGLKGADEESYFNYKHGTTYRCTIVVTRKQSVLYVDGKQICIGDGEDARVEKVKITSGDDWSPGELEVQDFVIFRATDKVMNP